MHKFCVLFWWYLYVGLKTFAPIDWTFAVACVGITVAAHSCSRSSDPGLGLGKLIGILFITLWNKILQIFDWNYFYVQPAELYDKLNFQIFFDWKELRFEISCLVDTETLFWATCLSKKIVHEAKITVFGLSAKINSYRPYYSLRP